jgi:hypothetical protein
MPLNWTGDTPAVRSVLIDSALDLGAPPRPWFCSAWQTWILILAISRHQLWAINAQLADEGKKFTFANAPPV